MARLQYRGIACLLTLTLFGSAQAEAQERKAYRHVDAAGNVTYSQTPPVDVKATKQVEKIDISPAQRGRGGDAGSYSIYDNPRYYSGGYDRQPMATPSAAYAQRLADLKAECERQRGTDCNNPSTLRNLEATHQPRSGATAVIRPRRPMLPMSPQRPPPQVPRNG